MFQLIMKKQYENPQIELVFCNTRETLANDNFFSDPWGFEDDLMVSEESDEEE